MIGKMCVIPNLYFLSIRCLRVVFVFIFLMFACGVSWAGLNQPPPPASVTVPSMDTDGSFLISWSNVAIADFYTIMENGNVIASVSGTSYNFSNKPENTYGYSVKACTDDPEVTIPCSDYTWGGTTQVLYPPGDPGAINVPTTSV